MNMLVFLRLLFFCCCALLLNEPGFTVSSLCPLVKLRWRRRFKGAKSARVAQRGEVLGLHVQRPVLPGNKKAHICRFCSKNIDILHSRDKKIKEAGVWVCKLLFVSCVIYAHVR